MELFSLAFSLFLLMDPIGNIPIYVSILHKLPAKRQRLIILRELCIALLIIIFFTYLGDPLLKLLRVDQTTVLISGGVILFIIALKMIFPKPHSDIVDHGEPFIVPLAIPLVAGPAVLAAVIIFAKKVENHFTLLGAIVIAWLVTTLILLSSSYLKRILGERGVLALERLMGLILTLIAIQMFLEGVGQFLQHTT